ncbi:MAG: hypothetical protein FWD28_09965 [Treponema sp.]|nr:hypothetical protein [Treponema sp.]
MKDKAILIGWIIGLLLLISLIWILTAPLQSHYLLRTVNNILINNEDPRRLSEPVKQPRSKAEPLGYWFSISGSTDKMFVFGVFQDGILVPLGAIVSSNGSVKQLLPLSAHAVQSFEIIPKSILQMYVSRIEEGYKQ